MKRDRTAIWRRSLTSRSLLPLMAAVLTLAFSSCTKEPLGNSMVGGDGVEVRVTFPINPTSKATTGGTEEGTTDENRLDRVTILIFNQDGSKLETVLSEDVTSSNSSLATTQPKWATDQTLIVTQIANPTAAKKIYAIANWSKTSFDKATYTEAMLTEEITIIAAVADINGDKAYPMLMSGSKAVPDLTSLFYQVTVDMERQSSKIRANLSITTAVQDNMPQIEWQLDLVKITVANVRDRSYVVGRKALPVTSTLLNSVPIAVDDTKPLSADQTVPATKDLKWSESVYITENYVEGLAPENKAASTYIVVQLPYKDRVTGIVEYDNYYKIHINDTRDAVSPHKVLRNTIYNFDIRILGMGSPFNNLVPDVNVDDVLTVNGWEKGEIVDADDLTNYFNIDRDTLGFQFSASSLKSTITTDVADWKLLKEDGTTIFSYAEGKVAPVVIDGLTYTLSGTAAQAVVTVSKPVSAAVFTPQKMFFEAKNLKVPFMVVSDNGVIPNSVLIAAGWPADKLPSEGGLQIAATGNVLPGGTLAANDPQRVKWSTVYETTGITEAGLGKGKGNYALLAALDATKYPIGQACKHLGPEWYVPSIDELVLIYNNKSLFGASYTFNTSGTGVYWSATEDDDSYSWMVVFNNGIPNADNRKTSAYRVRCVKDDYPPAPPPADSYIPTSVLAAAGWPADRLPATGLQVAMRGNVLPGGTPVVYERARLWSTENRVTGITETGLGKGKGNYAQFVPLVAGMYPVGKACKHLGAEWYMPSIDELVLIRDNMSLFGASYAFIDENYWSSSEFDYNSGWNLRLYVYHETPSPGFKTIDTRKVRCVREI